MAADLSIGEINDRIAELKIDQTVVDERGDDPMWKARAAAIGQKIHELERVRDLLPEQRTP